MPWSLDQLVSGQLLLRNDDFIARYLSTVTSDKMLSYRRETALQGTLVLAESGRLELRDNILLIL